jgi:FkbM family methyltransferase
MLQKLKYIYRANKYRHTSDSEEINYLIKHIFKGETVMDIGCHKGAYLYWMQQRVGVTGNVIAFEPQPTLHNYLSNIINDVQSYSNVKLYPYALSNKAGLLNFYVPKGKNETSPGASLNTQKNEQEDCTTLQVEVKRVDDFITEVGNKLSFIKIDVEGHELELLQGAQQTLNKYHPIVLIELEARHCSKERVNEVFAFITTMGYKGYFFNEHDLLPIEEFKFDIHQAQQGDRYWANPTYCNNFVFEPLKKTIY